MSLQTIISNSPLEQDEKDFLLQRLDMEGATPEVIASIKTALQEFIDSGFKDLGVAVDPNDPKAQSISDQFKEGVAAAEAEYNEEMENLSIDAAVIQAKTNKTIDTIQINAMKASMAT